MFFLDEAYYEFRGDTVISLVKKYDNIIIFRTFSKAFGLAGLRLGYIISNFENINLINKVRNGKEVSSLAQIAGVAAILNYSHYLNRVKDLIDVREWFYNEIKILDNYQVFESSSNFLLVKHSESKQIIKHLYKNKILVRDRSSMHLLNNCFRITIGSKQEMAKVLEILKLY
jgi:histidinol-phosphate aminotransferase